MRFRVGRSLLRTLYDGDEVFGMVDTPEQAAMVVSALIAHLETCEVCGMGVGRCQHTNAGYQQAVHRAEHFERSANATARVPESEAAETFLTPEAMERWRAHAAHGGPALRAVEDAEDAADRQAVIRRQAMPEARVCAKCGNPEPSHWGIGCGCDGFDPEPDDRERLLAEQQARIADLEGEVQRLVQSRSEQHRAEVEALVTQLGEAREQAVEAGQRAEAAESIEAADPVLAKYVVLAETAHKYLLSEGTFATAGERAVIRRRLVDILMGTGDGDGA